jgi:hypothetical protein
MTNFDEEYEFDESQLPNVLEAFKYSNALTELTPLPQLVEEFKKFQKPVDGVYLISIDIYLSFVNYILDPSLMELVKQGLVDYSFDSDKNDFVFKLK